jgi:5-oxoprolinase (ATP-hydrolysing)
MSRRSEELPVISVDVGGTFTDVAVVWPDGVLETRKVSTDARAPEEAVALALEQLALTKSGGWGRVLHGTTVATNALLERKLPRVGLLTTRGFADTLQIRRRKREKIYSLAWRPAPPLVPRELICEVEERVAADGMVVTALTDAELYRVAEWIDATGVETVAVAFLHSYVNSAHEFSVARHLADVAPLLPVTLSSDVDPEPGEYERSSTVVAHAALKPVLSRYVERLQEVVAAGESTAQLFVMQSSGGLATARQIIEQPARAVESGPAAGVLYAGSLAKTLGLLKAISFDMGGTTAKACLLEDGVAKETDELRVGGEMNAGETFVEKGGHPIRYRALDLVEVGAGGGSVCSIDEGGVLHVGPQSAGADPGPAAYGRGGVVPTVTDANVVLGLYESERGGIDLDVDRARAAIVEHVAVPLGLSAEDAAWLVVQVANSNMIGAIHAVSSERGRDPTDYALVAFGGGGPTHAPMIAAELGLTTVVVPEVAEVFSAVGLNTCPIQRDVKRAMPKPLRDVAVEPLDTALCALEAEVRGAMAADGVSGVVLTRGMDVRLTGQTSTLRLPVPACSSDAEFQEHVTRAFRSLYEQEYGRASHSDAIEVTAVYVRGEAIPATATFRYASDQKEPEPRSARIYLGPQHGWISCQRRRARTLTPTEVVLGPALLDLEQATILVPPGASARRDLASSIRVTLGPKTAPEDSSATVAVRPALDLFKNQLGAIVNRMAHTVSRAAFSTAVKEMHDFSVALCDARGRVIYQGLGILMHLASVGSAMRALDEGGWLPLKRGDVALLNDPYHGGSHLPDFFVITPAYAEDTLVAYTVAIAHMTDVGSMSAGSFMFGTRELLQEGLVIPPVRLYESGRLNTAVVDLIKRNVRFPREVEGDIQSLVAATARGAISIEELARERGTGHVIASMAELISYARDRGRSELAALGVAEAEFTDYLNDNGVSDDPVKLSCRVRIADGKAIVDFTGCDVQQPSSINAPHSSARSAALWGIRTQMAEDFPDNEGFYELVEVRTKPGTVADARDDAPVANRGLSVFRLADCVSGAMASMFPDRMPAAGDGSGDPITFAGYRDDGSYFVLLDVSGGTTGAGPWGDGYAGMAPPLANARNNPVEVLEGRYPIRVLRVEIEHGTGGDGHYRGGDSVTCEYELLCESAEVAVRCDRQRFPPWGLAGGGHGQPARHVLITASGERQELPAKHAFRMNRHDRLTRRSASGGGYGRSAK